MLVAVCAVLSHFSCVCLFETPQAVACQAAHPLVILQARILAWVAMLSSRDLLNPGIEPSSPALQDDPLLSDPLVWVIFRRDSIKKKTKQNPSLLKLPFCSLKSVFGSYFLALWACVHAKSLQSCVILCSPIDFNLSGSSLHWILQA